MKLWTVSILILSLFFTPTPRAYGTLGGVTQAISTSTTSGVEAQGQEEYVNEDSYKGHNHSNVVSSISLFLVSLTGVGMLRHCEGSVFSDHPWSAKIFAGAASLHVMSEVVTFFNYNNGPKYVPTAEGSDELSDAQREAFEKAIDKSAKAEKHVGEKATFTKYVRSGYNLAAAVAAAEMIHGYVDPEAKAKYLMKCDVDKFAKEEGEEALAEAGDESKGGTFLGNIFDGAKNAAGTGLKGIGSGLSGIGNFFGGAGEKISGAGDSLKGGADASALKKSSRTPASKKSSPLKGRPGAFLYPVSDPRLDSLPTNPRPVKLDFRGTSDAEALALYTQWDRYQKGAVSSLTLKEFHELEKRFEFSKDLFPKESRFNFVETLKLMAQKTEETLFPPAHAFVDLLASNIAPLLGITGGALIGFKHGSKRIKSLVNELFKSPERRLIAFGAFGLLASQVYKVNRSSEKSYREQKESLEDTLETYAGLSTSGTSSSGGSSSSGSSGLTDGTCLKYGSLPDPGCTCLQSNTCQGQVNSGSSGALMALQKELPQAFTQGARELEAAQKLVAVGQPSKLDKLGTLKNDGFDRVTKKAVSAYNNKSGNAIPFNEASSALSGKINGVSEESVNKGGGAQNFRSFSSAPFKRVSKRSIQQATKSGSSMQDFFSNLLDDGKGKSKQNTQEYSDEIKRGVAELQEKQSIQKDDGTSVLDKVGDAFKKSGIINRLIKKDDK